MIKTGRKIRRRPRQELVMELILSERAWEPGLEKLHDGRGGVQAFLKTEMRNVVVIWRRQARKLF